METISFFRFRYYRQQNFATEFREDETYVLLPSPQIDEDRAFEAFLNVVRITASIMALKRQFECRMAEHARHRPVVESAKFRCKFSSRKGSQAISMRASQVAKTAKALEEHVAQASKLQASFTKSLASLTAKLDADVE